VYLIEHLVFGIIALHNPTGDMEMAA
jgi:hypothetical protein